MRFTNLKLRNFTLGDPSYAIAQNAFFGVGGIEQDGAATLSGRGTLTATAMVVRNASATLTGRGTLSAAATREQRGTASLTGRGTLTANGQITKTSSATLTGRGTLTASGLREVRGVASLSGQGTLSAFASREQKGSASWSGRGTLTAAARVEKIGSASLSGRGSFQANANVEYAASAQLTGHGTLAASGSVFRDVPVDFWLTPLSTIKNLKIYSQDLTLSHDIATDSFQLRNDSLILSEVDEVLIPYKIVAFQTVTIDDDQFEIEDPDPQTVVATDTNLVVVPA